MAKITIKELYFGKKYDVQGAVNEELANLQDNSATDSTSFRELAIIRQTLIALQKLNKNGDCISDKELGDAVTVSLSPRMSELFELNSKDFGATLVCAIRYGMGRHTYMPSLITEFVTPLLPYINTNTLECINRDLRNPAVYGGLGDEKIDAPVWLRFHAKVENEINTRLEQPKPHRESDGINGSKTIAKPFLKWAGGKSQLLREIEQYYPIENGITKYAEPFVGGGAVLFDILSRYDLEAVYISDINKELINTYKTIRDHVEELICILKTMQDEYLPLNEDGRKKYYKTKRDDYNTSRRFIDKELRTTKAALMIFLNKTCFNGLFRVNRKGAFNVPMGAYKNPMICDEANLRAVSEKLQNVTIVCGDYRESADFIDEHTFVYFDPPYRPLNDTSSFTAYTENLFNDEEQIELAKFVDAMDKKGAKIVVSNSDPKNANEEDEFFDDLYSAHTIKRVEASRMINSNSTARGKIKEILVSNFKPTKEE